MILLTSHGLSGSRNRFFESTLDNPYYSAIDFNFDDSVRIRFDAWEPSILTRLAIERHWRQTNKTQIYLHR